MAVERSYTKPGVKLADLQSAAADRLADAEALLAAGQYASAITMGVYSLEIYLKVGICKKLGLTALPKAFEIHDLQSLLILSGLQSALNSSAPKAVLANWLQIADEAINLNELRYLPTSRWSESQARAFLEQLRHPVDGVIPWFLSQF